MAFITGLIRKEELEKVRKYHRLNMRLGAGVIVHVAQIFQNNIEGEEDGDFELVSVYVNCKVEDLLEIQRKPPVDEIGQKAIDLIISGEPYCIMGSGKQYFGNCNVKTVFDENKETIESIGGETWYPTGEILA
jgi:hypothetical protein